MPNQRELWRDRFSIDAGPVIPAAAPSLDGLISARQYPKRKTAKVCMQAITGLHHRPLVFHFLPLTWCVSDDHGRHTFALLNAAKLLSFVLVSAATRNRRQSEKSKSTPHPEVLPSSLSSSASSKLWMVHAMILCWLQLERGS